MMTKNKSSVKILLSAIWLFLLCPDVSAQQIIKRDSRISESICLISSDNMKDYINSLLIFHTRHNLSSQNRADFGIGASADYIEQKLIGFGRDNSNYSVERVNYKAGGKGSRLNRELTLTNIIATIKGDNPQDDRIIVLLAHYDSRVDDNTDSTTFAPGANDNGSGVAALMEISRILAARRLPVTVKLMFLSGEEHGLLGAAHMSAMAKENNWNIIAVLNNDMISNSHSSETNIVNNSVVRVFSENIPFTETSEQARERIFNSSENDSPSRQLARYIKECGERYVENLTIKLIHRNDRFGRGGDHTPFSRNGFTAVRICEYYENYDRTHKKVELIDGIQYGDIIEGVDFEYLRKNCAANLATVMNLVYAPAAPLNVFTDVSSLYNRTTVSWNAPDNCPKPYGYYLLIRETDSPVWQKKIFVQGESIVVPYSKDNYFFAVQSVNENGNESLAQFSKGKR